ncbi:uncharacterized protein [Venturia canescens]|uniref:uncharacterized protein n=1 Tax=Venturia canescens TaxID=32260 RepID=UPI001C9C1F93|nr:uncharacterized protein LOC122415503 [Venturia canescens]
MVGDMADIANTTVFTNGSSVSCGTSDLLRQAFQEVVDEDDQENEFVAFLQGDGEDSPTIHLTQAQASALRLTFEVDTVDDRNHDITYETEENTLLDEITRTTNLENSQNPSCTSVPLENLHFQNDNQHIKVECSDFEWTDDKSSIQSLANNHDNETISMNDLDLSQNNDSARRQLLEQLTEGDEPQKIYLTTQNSLKPAGPPNRSEEIRFPQETSQNYQKTDLRDSQAQILQRLPIILPSSQFIVKPTQTLLKNAKTVRILPGTSKINTIHTNAANGLHQNTQNGNITSQNSILLPKGTLLNTIAPRLINATPITTQLINGGTISTQLLNASQVLTTSCDFSNQNISTSNGNTSGVTRSVQRIGNPSLPIVGGLKMTPGIIRTGNNQQFVLPALKSNLETGNIVKTIQTINGNGKPGIGGSFLKSVQIPAQFLRNAATAFVKTVPANTTKITTSTNSPIILRTASILKAQDAKPVTTSASILRPTTQSPSNPISILKPQTKLVSHMKNKPSLMNSQNVVTSIANNLPNPRVVQKTTNCVQNDTAERTKLLQNGNKEKRNEATLATARVLKRAKVAGLHSPVALTAEQTDTTKPLGSSENPIQIVQQGHTFHSMQRLTQSQLKQIAHVLQQRSQEAAMPNERIVYRVVFPEELDLRMRNPANLLKGRGAKRGRPKKTAVRPPVPAPKMPTTLEEEHEDTKDDRKKVIARTRSGRLSRPPRHMVRDYKHLHHLDFMQPDLDDSDGGYSDYNTNADKLESDPTSKELLSGLEVPKRKISDHFRCPTCNKIYLGRTRMARHFEMHPDHGSPEQLPPPTPDPELKRAIVQDPLKRKGKKRGPWAYVTPEAKSERRQSKLKEAISVCENLEIVKIAAKPVLNAQSMFDLLILKSDHNVRNFLTELKNLMNKIRQQVGTMLSTANEIDSDNYDLVNLDEDVLCDALGLDPGLYRINNEAFNKSEEIFDELNTSIEEPPMKLQKTHNSEESKEHFEERMSSGFSESSDLSVSDFLNDRKSDSHANTNCPEVLMALTLMPRNHSPDENPELTKSSSMSKLLISNPEIQNQLSENQGFQKIDIGSTKSQSYRKLNNLKDGFTKLAEGLELSGCSSVFDKLNVNYEQTKQSLPTIDTLQQAFIKLEPMEQGFKLENTAVSSYAKETSQNYEKIDNSYENLETSSQSFVKGFHKLITKVEPLNVSEISVKNVAESRLGVSEEKMLVDSPICKIPDALPILQDSVPIMSNSCDTSIFGSNDNLDITKITGYDHIPHLDILTSGGVMDKHMMMDEKLVEQLHLVDQTNLVDELVSERLKNIMPDNILDSNLITNGANLDADLDFEALSEEFNRNTRS